MGLGREITAGGKAVTVELGATGGGIPEGTAKGSVADSYDFVQFSFLSFAIVEVACGLEIDFGIDDFATSVETATEADSAASIASLAALLSLTLRDVEALGAGTKEAVFLRRDLARRLPHCFPGRQLMPREVHRAHAGQPRSQC